MVNEQNASPDIQVKEEVQASPAEQSTPVSNDTAPETSASSAPERTKTFTEDQMHTISASVKRDVERKTEARLRAEYEAQYNSDKPQQQSSTDDSQEQPKVGIANYSEEQLYNAFKQRQEREQAEISQQNIANELLTKVQAAGIAQKIESSGIGNLPVNHPLIPMLNSLDNVADVINEFDSNPVKVANLLAVTMLNPMNGFKELQALSRSIKTNKEALAKEKAPAPPDQLKPSSYGLGGGASSVSTKRRNPAFRF